MKNALEMIIKRSATILGILLASATIAVANEGYVLHYDVPAKDNLLVKQRWKTKGLGCIQAALPVGNGRLGAMFSGGIDTEHLLTTDKLVAHGGSLELENLYFNYGRYLQLSCSRSAFVPSNLQELWNADLHVIS